MGIDDYIKMISREKGLEEGREVGLAEGREVGLTEGREVGLAEGLAKGRMEAKTEVVKQLLADKEFAIKKIAAIAGVSVAFVKEVKNSPALN